MKFDMHLGSADLIVRMSPADIGNVSHGKRVSTSDRGVNVTVTSGNESPLDYLERTWSEPRYGESASDHSARLARGVN